jgi:hypothetical protein
MAVGSSIGGQGFNRTYPGVLDAEMGSEEQRGTSYPMQLLEGMPTTTQTVAATGFRGSNTILRGGWSDTPGPFTRARRAIFRRDPHPEVGGMIRNNNIFNPRTWTRYGSQDMFFPGQGANKAYSPFNLSGGVNWLAKNDYLGKSLGEAAAANKGEVMGGGVFSQLSAAQRLRRVGDIDPLSRRGKSLASYFNRAGMEGTPITTGREAASAIHMSMPGALGQRIGGFAQGLHSATAPEAALARPEFMRGFNAVNTRLMNVAGLRAEQVGGKIGMKAGVGAIREAATGQAAKSAAAKAGTVLGEEALAKFGVRAGVETAGLLGARAALSAVPYVNVAMWAWMAYDITKAIIPASGKFVADAYKSYTGWGSNRMLGGNFKMNEAGMTSRSRGVAAIQNSRMNARSVLGSEAGGLAAYYG